MANKEKEATAIAQPKPQIPSMVAAVRREVSKLAANVEVIETRLVGVMRPGEVRADGVKVAMSSAAPVAESLAEFAGALAAYNARLKDVLARLEV